MVARDKLVKVAVAVHLAIAAMYGFHVPVELYIPRAVDRVLSFYGAFSGTRSRFDFFTPNVSSEARADFIVVSGDGKTRRVRLAATSNDEANRRLALMFTIYAYPSERERLLQAWGHYVLQVTPDAVEVTARVEVLDMPNMQDAAKGTVAAWREVGRATVRRGESPGR